MTVGLAQPRNFPASEALSDQMELRPRLLVVVPAYNEEDAVGDVVRSVRTNEAAYDVVVVDDGSTDLTVVRAEEAGAIVLRLPYNLGIGGAVQTGFLYARENDYDYAAQVDGDGQHDPEEIAKLLAVMRADPGIDMACGSRFLADDPDYRPPFGRRAGIRLFSLGLTAMLRRRVTDPTSGFRLCNRRAIDLFASDYPHDYPEVEAMLMLHAHNLRFEEVAVRMHQRSTGQSSITPWRSAHYMVKVSLALLAGALRRSAPDTAVHGDGS